MKNAKELPGCEAKDTLKHNLRCPKSALETCLIWNGSAAYCEWCYAVFSVKNNLFLDLSDLGIGPSTRQLLKRIWRTGQRRNKSVRTDGLSPRWPPLRNKGRGRAPETQGRKITEKSFTKEISDTESPASKGNQISQRSYLLAQSSSILFLSPRNEFQLLSSPTKEKHFFSFLLHTHHLVQPIQTSIISYFGSEVSHAT